MTKINNKRAFRPPVSEAEQVAALEVGACHWKMREMDRTAAESIEGAIVEEKRRLSSAATTTILRVKERYPERDYCITTACAVASNNRLYVGVMVERIEPGVLTEG